MATDTVSNYHLRTDALRVYLEGLFPGQRLEIREVSLLPLAWDGIFPSTSLRKLGLTWKVYGQ